MQMGIHMRLGWKTTAAVGAGLAIGARRMVRRRREIELAGKVVAITGGSRGLGLALAEAFAREGARLALCARNPEHLEQARQRLERLGAEVVVEQCDVSDREQVERFVSRTIEHYGRVDILVNNAGIISAGPFLMQTIADFEQMHAVMFWGTVYATFAALPHMLQQGSGRIVNITSIGGKVSVPHLSSYNVAKFAAVGFSEGIRAELAQHGILVTTVVPGLMRTGSYVNALFKGRRHAEYSLFSLIANSPITSTSVENAAHRIVDATRRGDAELTITPQAQLLARLEGLFPGFVAETLSIANRVLPGADVGSAHEVLSYHGYESRTAISESFLNTLGKQAAREYQWRDQGSGIRD